MSDYLDSPNWSAFRDDPQTWEHYVPNYFFERWDSLDAEAKDGLFDLCQRLANVVSSAMDD